MQHDLLVALERIQRFDGGRQLHAVVGGLGLAAMHRLAMTRGNQDGAPSAWTRIAPACSVGVNLNRSCQNQIL